MLNIKRVQSLCLGCLLICISQAYAIDIIPVQCVVDLKKNDATIVSRIGSCGYGIPLVVNNKSIIYRAGVKGGSGDKPEWNTKEVTPGFSATIWIGHSVSTENPLVNVSVDFSFVKLLEPKRMTVILSDGKAVGYDLPSIDTTTSSGSVIVSRGEMKLVSAWKDGEDSYQVHIGIR